MPIKAKVTMEFLYGPILPACKRFLSPIRNQPCGGLVGFQTILHKSLVPRPNPPPNAPLLFKFIWEYWLFRM
jgi:hypothetical protein